MVSRRCAADPRPLLDSVWHETVLHRGEAAQVVNSDMVALVKRISPARWLRAQLDQPGDGRSRPPHQSTTERCPPASLRHAPTCHCFFDGTSWQEMVPDFFQPSRRSQVFGWYTISGS
jgi:hypothetical protein